jgi:formate-dependent nitrite reductase membrane component NrfD
MTNERRLEQLREQAWEQGVVAGRGVDVSGGPIPRKPGYYGQPVVKPPVWSWEIPVYFFVGGLAGMSAVIAMIGFIFHRADLGHDGMWLAAIGAILSPILLTMDLGRPQLFINMLRVFKYKSPMSVGAWILTMFGACAVPGLLAAELHMHHIVGGSIDHLIRIVAALLILGSTFWGLLLATYTGVLLGATAIPVWFLHRLLLPIHFGAAGLGSAAALLELLGHRMAPLNAIGFLAAGIETALWFWLELHRHGAADRALHEARSGWLIRSGEILSGPLALLLRGFGLIPFAAISFLLGALVSRFGWVSAGKVSGCDPEAVFASQR